MGLKKTVEQIILSKSNSYKFYKDYYDKHHDVSTDKLDAQVAKLQKDFNNYKKRNDEYINSANFLFNKIFIDYELNNPKPLLDNIQKLCVELLTFVANVNKKYDLEWWIDVGNLLGAVRHGYFVPWDDDTDIGMMRKDYNKLCTVIEKEIENHKLDDIIQIVYRPRPIYGENVTTFLQLYVRHKVSTGKTPRLAGVDVFPYDFLKGYNKKSFDDEYLECRLAYFSDLNDKVGYDKALDTLYEDLNLSWEKTDLIVPGVEGAFGKRNLYKLMVLDYDTVFPLKELPYGETVFPAPNDPHTYLKSVYGDYLSVPKAVRRHPRIEQFRYATDAIEVFEEMNRRLKEVNDNFQF